MTQLRKTRPGSSFELRWCPAHEGVEGNERADKEAKLPAEEPEGQVSRLDDTDHYGRRGMLLPRSIANIR